MRANHAVTLGLCVGLTGLAMWAAGCGTDTFGTCADNNTCGGGGDAGVDGEVDSSTVVDSSMTGDTGTGVDTGTSDSSVPGDTGAPHDSSAGETGPSCEAGTVDCNGTCVNEQTDPNHCGSCSKVCPGPDAGMGMAQCTSGMCSVTCNGSTTLDCSGTCFDPHDVDNCGSCGNVCAVPSNGTATCTPGNTPPCGIACNSGYHACNGACDSNADPPSTDSCVLANQFGIFVSHGGSDAAGCGTMASPCQTIGHAMDLAKAGNSRVYACGSAGQYNENLVVGSSRDGVTVFGGLDCSAAQWVYNATKKAVLAPSAQGYALQVTGVTTGVTFEDFGFVSQAGTSAGQSSIAVFVSGSSNVLLERCSAQAGAGVAGQNQSQPAPYGGSAPSGSDGTGINGGGVTTNTSCSSSAGGAGGQPTAGGQAGTDGTPGPSDKGTVVECIASTGGGPGAPGTVGSTGTGSLTWASFAASGWAPSAGTSGGPGTVGQGGGGGASVDSSGGGGGGGAGGCGGGGGPAGTGGGSSIDVLAYQSSVDLETCTLTAANAGGGGGGALGQVGQTGGGHGNGSGGFACAGGKGGNGGNGGPGGGGAGGLSAGVVWFGTAPTVNGMSTPMAATMSGWNLGTAGAGGTGGSGVSCSSAGNDCGVAGTQGAVVQFP